MICLDLRTIAELATMIKSLTGDLVDIKYIPSNIPNRDCIFDNSKLRKLLLKDFLPFKDSLKREYEYMRKVLADDFHF